MLFVGSVLIARRRTTGPGPGGHGAEMYWQQLSMSVQWSNELSTIWRRRARTAVPSCCQYISTPSCPRGDPRASADAGRPASPRALCAPFPEHHAPSPSRWLDRAVRVMASSSQGATATIGSAHAWATDLGHRLGSLRLAAARCALVRRSARTRPEEHSCPREWSRQARRNPGGRAEPCHVPGPGQWLACWKNQGRKHRSVRQLDRRRDAFALGRVHARPGTTGALVDRGDFRRLRACVRGCSRQCHRGIRPLQRGAAQAVTRSPTTNLRRTFRRPRARRGARTVAPGCRAGGPATPPARAEGCRAPRRRRAP